MRSIKFCLAGAVMIALAGCASTSEYSSAPGSSSGGTLFDDDVDYQKMAIITEDALSKGYKIIWINPPQKPKSRRE